MSAKEPKLPEVTEVKRLRLRPGDALVVRLEQALTYHDADVVKHQIRRALRLPDDFPVLVLGSGADIGVVEYGTR